MKKINPNFLKLKRKITTLIPGVTSLTLYFLYANTASAQDPVNNVTSVELVNYLKIDSIEGLLEAILNIVVVLATPIIVFFIIYAGFLYATARGNAEQVKQATNALTYAIIGGVIILGSVAIATIVKNLVGAF